MYTYGSLPLTAKLLSTYPLKNKENMYKKSIKAFGEEKSKHQYKLSESSGKPILQIENSKLASYYRSTRCCS